VPNMLGKMWPHNRCRTALTRRAMRPAISLTIYTSERDRRMATLRAQAVINRSIADQSPGEVPLLEPPDHLRATL
jgi:hypothetical protein